MPRFPSAPRRQIDLGYATVRATRLTYVGELGWELYTPVEFAVGVHERLMAAGRDLGLASNAGYYAIDSLRIEKGYRAWGRELTPDINPFEAGLAFAVQSRQAGRVPRQARAAGTQDPPAEPPRSRAASCRWSSTHLTPTSGAANSSCATTCRSAPSRRRRSVTRSASPSRSASSPTRTVLRTRRGSSRAPSRSTSPASVTPHRLHLRAPLDSTATRA